MQSLGMGSWLPVALSADLPAGLVMPVRVPEGPVALWRSLSGRLSAFADRCPHRGMRLSHGFVRGETLSCIYHGWRYGETGACLRIPAHPQLEPPKAIRAKTWRTSEAGGVIWLALDEEATETPALPKGLQAVRSLAADATLASVEQAAGPAGEAAGLLSLGPARILLAPQGAQTLIHVLVAEGADAAQRVAASRAAETLRREAEALEKELAA
ncbi:MAG: oxidoreductase [Mesorhizobium amorphae]|nr:MAG: oxidoreductase [Mesorhizobium amorphae]